MDPISLISHVVVFLSLYFEIFFLISYISRQKGESLEETLFTPPVTILIPVFNEEKSVVGTINSVLALNYPKELMQVIIINDGSTDNTYNEVLKHFENHPQVEIYTKENGGKYTALNFGITKAKHDFIGSLDADSFVEPQSLQLIMNKFKDPEVMATIPSTVIFKPKTILQRAQRAEYNFGTFMRYTLSLLNSVYVTPGPFSFFRKKVFEIIGNYKHAHNTEDMEMAMRMQKHGMKIAHAPKAIIYTIGPDTVKKLYKQRVRWASGFMGNLNDYKHMFFNRKHGDLSMLVLPFITIATCAMVLFAFTTLFRIGKHVYQTVEKVAIVGFDFTSFNPLNYIYFEGNPLSILAIFMLLYGIMALTIGNKLAHGKAKFDIEFIYMILLYPIMYPFWIVKAAYNTLLSKTAPWR